MTFGISSIENNGQFFEWIERHGTIDHFEELADSPGDAGASVPLLCDARGPRFRLLERERTFRSLREHGRALGDPRCVPSAGRDPGRLPDPQMEDSKFPPMPYCVQFGEDSLDVRVADYGAIRSLVLFLS